MRRTEFPPLCDGRPADRHARLVSAPKLSAGPNVLCGRALLLCGHRRVEAIHSRRR